jgi:hypothetical protein
MGKDDGLELTIEVLYVPGCPNLQPAIGRLRSVLQSEAIDLPIQEIAIENEQTARLLRFPGSPTIRINGQDAEPQKEQSFGIACRLYPGGGGGLPSEETLHRAIAAARTQEAIQMNADGPAQG